MTSDPRAGMKGAGVRSIIWKELRENYRWALLGFIGMCVAMAVALVPDFRGLRVFSWNLLSIVSQEFQVVTAFGCAIIGLALGILQVAFESRGDRFSLLVHRPMARSAIFSAKCFAGAVLYLFATAVPFLLASWWAAGHIAAPFAGSMMLPGAVDITMGFAYYFAGMLTGLREARWYASRGIGIAAAAMCSCVTFVVGPFWIAILVTIAGVVTLATAAWASFVPGGSVSSQLLQGRAALAITLLVGLAALGTLTSLLIYQIGKELRIVSPRFVYVPAPGHQGKRIVGQADFHFLGLRPANQGDYWPPPRYRFKPRFVTLNRMQSGPPFSAQNWFFDRDEGAILQYDQSPGGDMSFAGYVDPMTGALESQKPERSLTYQGRSQAHLRFTWTYSQFGSRLAVFSEIVYAFEDRGARVLYTAAEGDPIIAATTLEDRYGMVRATLPHDGERVTPFGYAVVATHKAVVVLDRDGGELLRTGMIPEWERYDSVGVAQLDDDNGNPRYAVYFTTGHIHRREVPPAPDEVIRIVSAAGDVLEEHRVEPRLYPWGSEPLTSDFAGPWMPVAAMAFAWLEGGWRLDVWHSNLLERWYLYVGIALVSAICTLAITRRYSFSKGRVALWTGMGFVFGLVGLFTLLCLETWPARERCHACGRRRLVTRATCEYCGAEWPAPQPDGTEIFEPAA